MVQVAVAHTFEEEEEEAAALLNVELPLDALAFERVGCARLVGEVLTNS